MLCGCSYKKNKSYRLYNERVSDSQGVFITFDQRLFMGTTILLLFNK